MKPRRSLIHREELASNEPGARDASLARVRLGWLFLGFAAIACARGVDDGSPPVATTTTSSPNQAASDAAAPAAQEGGPSAATSSSASGAVHVDPPGEPPDASAPPVDAAPPPPPPPPPPPFEVTNETLTVWGKARAYVLVVPASYDATRTYPLTLVLHGDGVDGAGMRALLPFESASGQDAIVAYPTGTGNSWDLYTPVDEDADVAYLVQLVDALRGRFHIGDAFAVGLSSGAFMANQMACRKPGLFRGIVSHSGGTPDEPNASHGSWGGDFVRCNGQSSGVAAMVIHGTADTAVPFPSGEHDASYWATVNGCGSGYSATSPSPCQSRNGCPSDKRVVFCAVDGLGHALWDQASSAAWSFISGL